MEQVRRGAVVVARRDGDKARPMVVLRSDALIELSHLTVVPLTSDLVPENVLRPTVAPDADNGLHTVSQAMTDWPQTIRTGEIGAVIGQLDRATMSRITTQLAVVLGFGE
jgi:mRNA interferase MazF